METFTPIEKETITTLQFPKEEVLTEVHAIQQRAIDLQRSMT